MYALTAPVFDLPRPLSLPSSISTAARLAIILNLGSHFAPYARFIIKKLRILIRYMCHINKQHTYTQTCMCSCMCICFYVCIAVKPHGCSLAAAFWCCKCVGERRFGGIVGVGCLAIFNACLNINKTRVNKQFFRAINCFSYPDFFEKPHIKKYITWFWLKICLLLKVCTLDRNLKFI